MATRDYLISSHLFSFYPGIIFTRQPGAPESCEITERLKYTAFNWVFGSVKVKQKNTFETQMKRVDCPLSFFFVLLFFFASVKQHFFPKCLEMEHPPEEFMTCPS